MIRFEVTGATPEEFAENAVAAYGTLMVGLQACMTELSRLRAMAQPIAPEMSGSESSSSASKADEVSEEVVDFAMELDRRGGLIQKKIEERKKLASDKVDDLFVEKKEATGPTPMDGSSQQTKKSDKPKSAKGPKLDDLKTRLSEVIVAATERWDQKRANAYARKLLGSVGVQKISDMKPEHYPDFWGMSEGFLNGTAPE